MIDGFGSTEAGVSISRTPDTPADALGPLLAPIAVVDPDDGIVHAKARTVLVCADEAGHKRPLPDAARAALEKLLTTQ